MLLVFAGLRGDLCSMNILLAPLFPLAALLALSPDQPSKIDPPKPVVAVQPVITADPEPAPIVEKPVFIQDQHQAAEEPVIIADQQEPAPVSTPEASEDLSDQPDLIEEPPVEVSHEAILAGATKGLTEARTAKGVFIQTDTFGARETGEFYIRRPNRVRFEYGSPMRLLVVSDGATIHYKDLELETENSAPLSATPLKLFLGQDVDLTTDENVVEVRSLSDRHLVVVEDQRSDEEERIDGQLMLMFAKDSYDLMGWWALDASGGQTRVDLLRVEKNAKLSAKLFVIEDEDDDRRR